MLVEFALEEKYCIFTTVILASTRLHFSCILNQTGSLEFSLTYEVRRINHLIKHDYNQHNHPVITIDDAAQHIAGKNYIRKLDCSPASECLQIADEQSIQLLSFKFGAGAFAYRRLAQGMNKSLSAFNSPVREYLEPVVKADRCAQ